MPEYNYTRELVSGKYNIHFSNEKVKLHKEIKDAFPGKTLNYINCHGVDVDIGITETLDAGEITTLDTVVQDHKDNASTNITDAPTYPATDINVVVKDTSNSTSYVVSAEFIFRGTNVLGIPAAIKAITDSVTSGDIKIYDVTNAETICEKISVTAGSPTIVDLGVLSNLPVEEALFEIQIRKVGSTINLYGISIHF